MRNWLWIPLMLLLAPAGFAKVHFTCADGTPCDGVPKASTHSCCQSSCSDGQCVIHIFPSTDGWSQTATHSFAVPSALSIIPVIDIFEPACNRLFNITQPNARPPDQPARWIGLGSRAPPVPLTASL